jgi:hypothetical protein
LLLVGFAREKERRKKKRGRIDGLANFHLNFERFKFLVSVGGGYLRGG